MAICSPTKIGITGTRNGWTDQQRVIFVSRCLPLYSFEFHHGLCVGVDCQSHDEVRNLAPHGRIIGHPSVDKKLQKEVNCDELREAKTHFARNRDIVNETDILIVVPMQMEWQSRGGTWYTHDYGVNRGKEVFVIWPDGKLERRTNK